MSDQIRTNLLNRTLNHVRNVWQDVSGSAFQKHLKLSPSLPDDEIPQLKDWINSCLNHPGGEVTARQHTAQLGSNYLDMDTDGRLRFLQLLSRDYDVDNNIIEAAIEQWREASPEQRPAARITLRDSLDPPRQRLLTQFTELPDGVKFLVDMRAELLHQLRHQPELVTLEADLKRVLVNWFDIGLLRLEQITWQSSAQILEKLIAYEAVHAIQSWDDLKNRLESDRRCFAFFHPNMPDEPLIFVEVALVQGLADNVQTLLDEQAPVLDLSQADTAIFYSISNAQKGLAGISFGNFLIKQVVRKLQQDFPGLKQFSTLSPIPGFTRWLSRQDDEQLAAIPGGAAWIQIRQPQWASEWTFGWQQQEAIERSYREPLLQLAAHYLVVEKRRGETALDPVSHFHLSNGAEVARINWLADCSDNGLKQSAGMMVNYLYNLDKITQRVQDYSAEGDVAMSSAVKALLKV
ncbi:MAG: malonyl-CoA decarboxylase [Oceanobacter sp.]